jgi:hypothetical protein
VTSVVELYCCEDSVVCNEDESSEVNEVKSVEVGETVDVAVVVVGI